VQLTDEGRERLESIIPEHLTQVEESFTGLLSSTELARFTATLRKLRDHLNPGAAQLTPGCSH
jgi:DNA-binding MarR family transcriptional regulator